MGSGIAESVAVAGLPVVVRDVDRPSIDRARARIEDSLQRAVRRGRLEPVAAEEARERIELTVDLGPVSEADIVIEAVPEHERLKVDVMHAIDEVIDETTIVASNT